MLITTSEGVELFVTREELTVLRRNVALYYTKKRYLNREGEWETEADRRPEWSTFQQRLVSPGEIEFIRANPLSESEIRQVVARCVKNLDKAGYPHDDALAEYIKPAVRDAQDWLPLLGACEQLGFHISGLLKREENHLILAFCDLHVLMFELDRFVYEEFDRSNDEAEKERLAEASRLAGSQEREARLLRHRNRRRD